jgi:hypothetical protein
MCRMASLSLLQHPVGVPGVVSQHCSCKRAFRFFEGATTRYPRTFPVSVSSVPIASHSLSMGTQCGGYLKRAVSEGSESKIQIMLKS